MVACISDGIFFWLCMREVYGKRGNAFDRAALHRMGSVMAFCSKERQNLQPISGSTMGKRGQRRKNLSGIRPWTWVQGSSSGQRYGLVTPKSGFTAGKSKQRWARPTGSCIITTVQRRKKRKHGHKIPLWLLLEIGRTGSWVAYGLRREHLIEQLQTPEGQSWWRYGMYEVRV